MADKRELNCRCSTNNTKFPCPGYELCLNMCIRVKTDDWKSPVENFQNKSLRLFNKEIDTKFIKT